VGHSKDRGSCTCILHGWIPENETCKRKNKVKKMPKKLKKDKPIDA